MSTERTALRNCTRWTKTDRGLVADLLGGFDISVLDAGGVPSPASPATSDWSARHDRHS